VAWDTIVCIGIMDPALTKSGTSDREAFTVTTCPPARASYFPLFHAHQALGLPSEATGRYTSVVAIPVALFAGTDTGAARMSAPNMY